MARTTHPTTTRRHRRSQPDIALDANFGRQWRKYHSRDRNVRNRGHFDDEEEFFGRGEKSFADWLLKEQMGMLPEQQPIDEIPVLTLFDNIAWDKIESDGETQEYLDGFDQDGEPIGDHAYGLYDDPQAWYDTSYGDDYYDGLSGYPLEQPYEESDAEMEQRKERFDNDPYHNFACMVRYNDLPLIFGEHEAWENPGWSVRHMPRG